MEILLLHNILNRNIRVHLDDLLVNSFRLRREKGSSRLSFGNYSYRGEIGSIKEFKDTLSRDLRKNFMIEHDDNIVVYYPEVSKKRAGIGKREIF